MWAGPEVQQQEEQVNAALAAIADKAGSSRALLKGFSLVKWKQVENIYSPFACSLSQAINEALQYQIPESEYRCVVRAYKDNRERFMYRRFVADVVSRLNVESLRLLKEHTTSKFDIYNSFSCRSVIEKVSPSTDIPRLVPRSKEELLDCLSQAMDSLFHQRLGINVDTFKAIGNLDKLQFGRELNRVLNVSLSKREISLLFDVFDFDDKGEITARELHEGLSNLRVHEIKRDKTRAEEMSVSNSSETNQEKSFRSASSQYTNDLTSSWTENYEYDPREFQKAIKKISIVFKRLPPNSPIPTLHLPDGYISRKVVRDAFHRDLRLKLSQKEINSLCFKLKTNPEQTPGADSSIEDMGMMFLGKTVKTLVVRICKSASRELPSLV